MKIIKIIVIALIACVVIAAAVSLFKNYRKKEYAEFVKKTNEQVVSIMDAFVPEIKELFYNNKDVFVEEINKTPSLKTIIVDDEKISISYEDISIQVKDAVYFTVDSTIGTQGAVSYKVSIVYFSDDTFDENNLNSPYERFVKLENDWYIYKEFLWGV
jgi:sugar-specific transcriptional regulator TrmB